MDKEDSDMAARIRRLIKVFVGCTCQKTRFLTLRPICLFKMAKETFRMMIIKYTLGFSVMAVMTRFVVLGTSALFAPIMTCAKRVKARACMCNTT